MAGCGSGGIFAQKDRSSPTGFSVWESIECICWKHQLTNSDVLDGFIRTPSALLQIVGRGCSEPVGTLAKLMDSTTTVTLLHIRQYGYLP